MHSKFVFVSSTKDVYVFEKNITFERKGTECCLCIWQASLKHGTMNWENTRVICSIVKGADKHTHIFEELNQSFVFLFKITHVAKIQIFMHNFNSCEDISKLQVSTFEKQDLECVL